VIPIEVTQTPWHFTTCLDLFDHWQTVFAGVLALAAGLITVLVINKQTVTTVRLEQTRNASEASAFHAMLEAAMTRVLAETTLAKKTHQILAQKAAGVSDEVLAVRRCITKGAFAELRAACVRQGGSLTGEFLDLEREIDSFAAPSRSQAGLVEQLDLIETKAAELRRRPPRASDGPHCDLSSRVRGDRQNASARVCRL
jgi:hypothetical protein